MHSLFAVIYGEGEGGTTPGRGTGEIVGARERGEVDESVVGQRE